MRSKRVPVEVLGRHGCRFGGKGHWAASVAGDQGECLSPWQMAGGGEHILTEGRWGKAVAEGSCGEPRPVIQRGARLRCCCKRL